MGAVEALDATTVSSGFDIIARTAPLTLLETARLDETSNLPSRCKKARPWTSAHDAVDIASGSAAGNTFCTTDLRYPWIVSTAATRSGALGSHGSPNMTRKSPGRVSANCT